MRSLLRFGEDKAEKQLRSESFELLERLDLADLAFLPAADQPFGTLKRLELARALAAKPKLLLLDEPAGGLTHSEVDELSSTILRVRDEFDLSILLVEHHMAMVMGISDLVVAMNFGKKIAEGKPTEVRSHPRGHLGLSGSARRMSLLEVQDLYANYGTADVLHGINLTVENGGGRRDSGCQRRW